MTRQVDSISLTLDHTQTHYIITALDNKNGKKYTIAKIMHDTDYEKKPSVKSIIGANEHFEHIVKNGRELSYFQLGCYVEHFEVLLSNGELLSIPWNDAKIIVINGIQCEESYNQMVARHISERGMLV